MFLSQAGLQLLELISAFSHSVLDAQLSRLFLSAWLSIYEKI